MVGHITATPCSRGLQGSRRSPPNGRSATVRGEITIYSFRDLWISEAMMAGNDIATVAKMAGTGVSMICIGSTRTGRNRDFVNEVLA